MGDDEAGAEGQTARLGPRRLHVRFDGNVILDRERIERPACGGKRTMNALTLLKSDHTEVKKMLSDLEETTERAEKTRTEGLATLKH